MPIRFHLDENVDDRVAAGLRRRGIDDTLAREGGREGVDDRTQPAFANSTGSVLMTHDADYLRLHREGVPHAGIAYCRQGTLSAGQIIRGLTLIHDVLIEVEMVNRIEYL